MTSPYPEWILSCASDTEIPYSFFETAENMPIQFRSTSLSHAADDSVRAAKE
jgi:hypothetical protein